MLWRVRPALRSFPLSYRGEDKQKASGSGLATGSVGLLLYMQSPRKYKVFLIEKDNAKPFALRRFFLYYEFVDVLRFRECSWRERNSQMAEFVGGYEAGKGKDQREDSHATRLSCIPRAVFQRLQRVGRYLRIKDCIRERSVPTAWLLWTWAKTVLPFGGRHRKGQDPKISFVDC